MKRLIRLGRSTRALLAANALLAVTIVLQLAFPAAPSTAAAATAAGDGAELPEFGDVSLNPPAASVFGDMLDRPMFFADRKMPEPPKKEAPPPPPRPLMLKLQGIALAGGSRVAVLRNTSNKLLVQLAEGDVHDGWTLEELTTTSARFSRGGRTAELLLDPADTDRRSR